MPTSTNKFGFTALSSPEDAGDESPEADEYQTSFALEYYVEEVTRKGKEMESRRTPDGESQGKQVN